MDEGIGGLILLVVLAAAGYGGYQFFQNYTSLSHSEVSGTVDYSDCRAQITLDQTNFAQHGGKLVCKDQKTNSGKSMGGQCVYVQLDSSGKCQTAYIYNKPADETCGNNSYLTVDDKCSCDIGYVSSNGSCISNTQQCQSEYGLNSYGVIGNSPGTSECYCNTGYIWNSARTSCISLYGSYY